MRYLIVSLLLLSLVFTGPAIAAPDSGPVTKAPVTKTETKKAPASQPVSKVKDFPGTKPPTDISGGIQEAETLWNAIKAKAWWLVAASGIFIVMLLLQLFGLFKKMGKRWTWIVTGGLSLLAALFLAFDKNGFSWGSFTAFATAGPTIAWLRGFIKKAVLNKGKNLTYGQGQDNVKEPS